MQHFFAVPQGPDTDCWGAIMIKPSSIQVCIIIAAHLLGPVPHIFQALTATCSFWGPNTHRACAQVGQMLLFLRVSHNNRMLPFVTQLMDLIASHSKAPQPAPAPSLVPASTLQPGAQDLLQLCRHQQQRNSFVIAAVSLGVFHPIPVLDPSAALKKL